MTKRLFLLLLLKKCFIPQATFLIFETGNFATLLLTARLRQHLQKHTRFLPFSICKKKRENGKKQKAYRYESEKPVKIGIDTNNLTETPKNSIKLPNLPYTPLIPVYAYHSPRFNPSLSFWYHSLSRIFPLNHNLHKIQVNDGIATKTI